jgi:hypothetical protein
MWYNSLINSTHPAIKRPKYTKGVSLKMILLFITTKSPSVNSHTPTPSTGPLRQAQDAASTSSGGASGHGVDNRPEVSLFALGRITTTPGAKEILALYPGLAEALLNRHKIGDWGEVSEADAYENDMSVEHGFRILSAYRSPAGDRLWLITEADRSATTFLLPSEY